MKLLILSLIVFTFLFDVFLTLLNYNNRNHPIPSNVSDVYEPTDYKQWLNYTMENVRFSLIVQTLELIVNLSLFIFGFFPWLFHVCEQITSSFEVQTLLFIGFFYVIDFVISIPSTYYAQFKIEAQYGFNKMTHKTFIIDKVKSLFLTIVLGGGILYLLSLIYRVVGFEFYLYTFMILLVILLFVNLFYVKLFLPIFNKLTPLQDGELKEAIIHFANQVGYEVAKISVMDASKRSTKLNAFFSGYGRFKQVVLFDTLIKEMNTDQIVSVLAHEIGHAKHKHILKNITQLVLNLAIFMVVLMVTIQIDAFSQAFGFKQANFGFGLILFSVLISPISILTQSIESSISRKHEYEADAFAAKVGFGVPLIEALKILSKKNYANLTPHPLYVALRYSHPPIHLRIESIQNEIRE